MSLHPASTHPLAVVFVTHRVQLQRTAERIVRDPHRAEDLLHDAYLRAAAAPCQALAEPLSYCHRIVRNLAIDEHRRVAREGELFDDASTEDDPCCPWACPEREASGREQLGLVCRALAGLPERCRQAFELHQLEGLTLREVAVRLQLSLASTHALLAQARAQCRAALQAAC